MQKLQTKEQKMTSRRAVAPIIATLLLVAIAVVGGSIIFVFSQGFFSSAQISGAPQIESLEILGYDTSDVLEIQLHNGICTSGNDPSDILTPCTAAWDGVLANDGLIPGDRVAVYLQNQSVGPVTITEVLIAGLEYVYPAIAPTVDLTAIGGANSPANGEYFIVKQGIDGFPAEVSIEATPVLAPGEEVSLLFTLEDSLTVGRDAQIKITTANGAVFVGTLISGQQSG